MFANEDTSQDEWIKELIDDPVHEENPLKPALEKLFQREKKSQTQLKRLIEISDGFGNFQIETFLTNYYKQVERIEKISHIADRYQEKMRNMSEKLKQAAEHERDYIRHAFSRYVSPNRVQYLIDNPDSLILSGEYRECSFIMTDLSDFTTLMEKYQPHECVALLNNYLEEMIGIVFKHHGTLDKIVGDALVIIFSAPIVQPNHCQLALECAMALDACAMQFAADKNNQGIKIGITRIGVCTGNVLIGNFGGKNMFDFGALGDPTNIASRLESANKQFGTRICVAESTLSQSKNIWARPIGSLILKGKYKKIKAFELLSESQFNSPLTSGYLAAYQKMDAEDPSALEAFAALVESYPDDTLSRYHYDRLLQISMFSRRKNDCDQDKGSTITLLNK
jgi:class 3 adenylate cyclase